MIDLNRSSYRALRNMTRAIARGDFAAALKWSLIFDGQLMIAKRFSDLLQQRPRRNLRKRQRKRATQAAEAAALQPRPSNKPEAQAPAPRIGPTMLAPEGFSPGGTPNWVINRRRLERAGLK